MSSWGISAPILSDEYRRSCHQQWPCDEVYGVGKELMCDFHFGGKPTAVCVEVIEEGSGRSSSPGKLRVRVTKTEHAYRKDEILEVNTFQAVPKGHTFVRGYYTRVRTNYYWTKNENSNISPSPSGQAVQPAARNPVLAG